jgi:hypothetical protein
MDKLAQLKKLKQLGHWYGELKENLPSGGMVAEKYFNPQFKTVMENLRQVDDTIRSFALGVKIGNPHESFEPGKSLKDLIKSIKSNLNRKEYMAAAADFATFDDVFSKINTQIKYLNLTVDSVHDEFLFGKEDKAVLTDEQKQRLLALKKKYSHIERSYQLQIVKNAGIMDFIHNSFTNRGKALSMWEERYPKKSKDLKDGGFKLLKDAENCLGHIINNLKEMAEARSSRNPEKYMSLALKISDLYGKFDVNFKDYYVRCIKPFDVYFEKFDNNAKENNIQTPVQATPAPTFDADLNMPAAKNQAQSSNNIATVPSIPAAQPSKQVVNVDTNADPHSQTQFPPQSKVPNTLPSSSGPETLKAGPPSMSEHTPTIPSPPPSTMPPVLRPAHLLANDNGEEEFKSDQVAKDLKLVTYTNFYNSLQRLSSESPLILKKYISKYAKSIQGSDPETAVHLFKIANRIGL